MDEPFWPYVLQVRVRFRDLDGFGHVNNAVFVTYLEQARTDCYLAAHGRTDPFESGAGLDFVVARLELDYVSPILSGDVVQITVFPTHVGNSSFTFGYEARARDAVVARASTVLVAHDHQAGRSQPLSAAFRKNLETGLARGKT